MKKQYFKATSIKGFFFFWVPRTPCWLGLVWLWCLENSWKPPQKTSICHREEKKIWRRKEKIAESSCGPTKSWRCTNNTRAASLASADRWQNLKAKQNKRERYECKYPQKKDDAIKLWHYKERWKLKKIDGGWNKRVIIWKDGNRRPIAGHFADDRGAERWTKRGRVRDDGDHRRASPEWWNITAE